MNTRGYGGVGWKPHRGGEGRKTISLCLAMLLLLPWFFLAACGGGSSSGSADDSGGVQTIDLLAIVDFVLEQSEGASLPYLAGGGIEDVAAVGVEVWEANNGPQVLAETDLIQVQTGLWEGELQDLPVGFSLDFIGRAYDATRLNTLYMGFTNQTLSLSGPNTVQLDMTAVDVGLNDLPVIVSALIPDVIGTLTEGNLISVGISHSSVVGFTASVTGGLISPQSGTFDPNLSGLQGLQYDAPLIADTYALTVKVWDPSQPGATVSTQFPLNVVLSTVTATATALFGPAITGIHFVRSATDLTISLDVSSAAGSVSYSWSGTGGFAGITGATTNPLVIGDFLDTMAGEIAVSVTDASGLVTSLTYVIDAGDFPYNVTSP